MDDRFAAELARYGPSSSYPLPTLLEARSYCARFARNHTENFTVVSLLLPRRLIKHFQPIYSWCRWADDLADETGGGSRTLDLLRWWREELDRCFAGKPRHPITVALRSTIEKFGIPRKLFQDLLFAFEQDQLVRSYLSFDQLLAYCKGSADPVGRMVLHLCEAFNRTNAALSDDICTGLQLANFWQDVSRDLDKGRIYIPEADRLHFDVPERELFARKFTKRFAALMRFEVDRTWALFHRGYSLVERVPEDVRADIELFVRGGMAILEKIESARFDVLSRRPKLQKWEKGVMVARAVWSKLRRAWRDNMSSDWKAES